MVLNSASVKAAVSTNVNIIANADRVGLLASLTSHPGQILNSCVLSDCNLSSVTADSHSVPKGGALTEKDVADNSCIGSNPVTLKNMESDL